MFLKMKKLITISFCLFAITCFVSAQDTIYKKDGAEIQAKVIEITGETVKYKDYNHLAGPVRNMLLTEVFMVVHEDGTREVIQKNQAASEPSDTASSAIKSTPVATGKGINVVLEDKREYPLVYGEMLSRAILITGTKHKLKDKKNKVFPAVANIFKDRLKKKGISSTADAQYILEIDIDKIYEHLHDKVTFTQVSTQLNTVVTLKESNSVVYTTQLSGDYTGKVSFIRDYVKQNGYKANTPGSAFLFVIDDIIKQLLSDSEFQKYYPSN